ncbi:glucose-1-phosphate adenylyltransferase [bacterium]|nr:glucose-1-phosphate adenylyltransferase [bacterium]
MSENVLGIIMAGGAGSRLWPLTKDRAKPAVPIAGKFRLIDIPISNCINSSIRKIFVLTQFNSVSLNRHISSTYFFAPFSQGFVQILAAQQTLEYTDWYQGTADSVRKNLRYFQTKGVDYHLILAGDHLYSMDYQDLLTFHIENKAEVTVGVLPVSAEQVPGFGILKLGDNGQIVDFIEKPQTEEAMAPYRLSPDMLKKYRYASDNRQFLGSMGIYLFNRDILYDVLSDSDHADFGKGIIPHAIRTRKVYGYLFDGYWEDVGTIGSYYNAMMDLCTPMPKFNFYLQRRPIYSRPRYLPGAKVAGCRVCNSIISDGSILEECSVESSMIGIRSRIRSGSQIRNSIIMGRDFYENDEDREENLKRDLPDTLIGGDCIIEKAIIDKNARIGDNVQILNRNRDQEVKEDNYVIREGIVIVPKNGIIPSGTVIG